MPAPNYTASGNAYGSSPSALVVNSTSGSIVRQAAAKSVAVYPEERPAGWARVGDEMGAEPAQVRSEAADELQRGVEEDLLVPGLVPGEPVPVVVAL